MEMDANKTALVIFDLQEGVVGMPTQPYSATSIGVDTTYGCVRQTQS